VGIGCLMAVAAVPSLALVVGFVVLFGGNQGARGPMVATLAARLFGGRGLSAIYGAITTGLGFGGAIASYASGWLHDLTGGYVASFAMAMTLAFLGMLPFWLVPELREADGDRSIGD
jgi:fucose permease